MMEGINTFQNNRNSAVFKDGVDGQACFINGIIFDGNKTSTFTGNNVSLKNGDIIGSRQYIKKFPFTPKTFYIDVIETEWSDKDETVEKSGGGWWTSIVKDESQLKEVFEYYEKYE